MDGELLLQRRRDNGCWGYAGGSVEPSERAEDTARRELFEETGLLADALELITAFSGPDAYYRYPNGDEVYNIDVVFCCTRYHGELKADSREVTELCFFPPDRLPEPLSPPIIAPLRTYIERRLSKEKEEHYVHKA